MKPFPTLSPSAISGFEQCPKQWYLTKIEKLYPFTVTEQITYGNEVHKNLEMYTKYQTPLPDHLEHIGKIIDTAREEYILCAELEIAIDKDWKPVGYWDRSAMLRGKIDFVAVSRKQAMIIDWKTGNPKPDPFQIQVYGAMLYQVLGVPNIACGYAWLKTRSRNTYWVTSQNFPILKDDIEKRIQSMQAAYEKQEFDARTSPLCCWCPALNDCPEAIYYKENIKRWRK